MQPAPLWQRLKQLRGQNEATDTRLLIKSGKKKRINPLVAGAIASMKRDARISAAVPTKDAIIERLVYPIINEAARCLDENIVERPEDVDLAMVFGTGFAPFRGGPMRYADSIGFENVVSSLEKYAAQHSRLTPSDALRNLAAQGPGITDPFREQSDRAVA
jgi:3-hydroxyacyl-CoA dehydrogenase